MQAAFRRVDRSLLGMQRKFLEVGKFAAQLLVLPVAGATALALGIKSAIDVGGELSDLAAQTGAAAGELLILQQEFKNNGKAAEDVGRDINKMQKSIATGTGAETIAGLGINLEELKKQTPVEQFHKLGAAINDIKNPAQKSAAAMEIFGRSGGELLALFAADGFGEAAAQVGVQADLLSKNAALFDDVSDKLQLAGLKTQGFFVGVADKVIPVLKPVLDEIANMDFAGMGQEAGSVIAAFVQSFSDGNLGEVLFASAIVSLAKFGTALVGFVTGVANGIWKILSAVALNVISLFEVLSMTDFWTGMGYAMIGIAERFIAMLLDGVAAMLDQLARIPFLKNQMGGAAASVRSSADGMRSGEQQLYSVSANLIAPILERADQRNQKGFQEMGAAFSNGFDAGNSFFDISPLENRLSDLQDGIMSQVMSVSSRSLAAMDGSPSKRNSMEFDAGIAKVGVNSLQRIGGGGGVGGGDPLLSESQRQTGILARIEQHLSPSHSRGGSFVPVFG